MPAFPRAFPSGALGATIMFALASSAGAQVGFQWLGQLPGAADSEANAISADGTTVVGTSLTPPVRAFRWTAATGMQDLGVVAGQLESYATAVSADGSVVVGWSQNPGQSRPFRWTAATGMVSLIDPSGCSAPNFVGYRAYGVSADGSVIVGDADPCTNTAFRWTAATGVQLLPRLLCGTDHARWVAPDGSFAVGWSTGAAPPACTGATGTVAAMWPAGGGAIAMGPLPGAGPSTFATAASSDGSVLVGGTSDPASTTTDAARWTAQSGWVTLNAGAGSRCLATTADGAVLAGFHTRLNTQCVLSPIAFTWNAVSGIRELDFGTSTEARAISANGRSMAGVGFWYLLNQRAGWIVQAATSPPSLCYANCDNSTAAPILNVADFSCFLRRFVAGDPYALCDGGACCPGCLNVQQFSCFLMKFAYGCSAP